MEWNWCHFVIIRHGEAERQEGREIGKEKNGRKEKDGGRGGGRGLRTQLVNHLLLKLEEGSWDPSSYASVGWACLQVSCVED